MRYSAFISYSHRDRRDAIRLHRALESYRVPKRLRGTASALGPIPSRLPPVFRDRDELSAASDLGQAVRDALAEAAHLIVLCSPASAASRWVDAEIREFVRLGRRDRIICYLVEPAKGDAPLPSIPPALLEDDVGEPLAADPGPHADGRRGATLKILAAMLGVPYDELRQREAARRQRRMVAALGAFAVLTVILAGLTMFALISRNEAVEQRDLARERTITAERTVDFVKSMFQVSDPSQARGETITAREILDRGAARIDRELASEPAVRAELGLTLGEVYGSLGLYPRGRALIDRSLAIPHDRADLSVRQRIARGELLFLTGDYEQAARVLRQAASMAGSLPDGAAPRTRALFGLGQALSATGDDAGAATALSQALRLDEARLGPNHADVARDLEGLGLNDFARGDLASARAHVERALRIRRATEGERSPSVADNLNTLGSIAYRQVDLPAAERYFRGNIAVSERVLGAGHPDLAVSLNNYARVLIDQRRFAAARPLLRRALAIYEMQGKDMQDDKAYLLSNLAYVEEGLNNGRNAVRTMSRAVALAEASEHLLRGQMMADLAGLSCRSGSPSGAAQLLARARPLVREVFSNDPWRGAWLELRHAQCLAAAGKKEKARALLKGAAPVILAKWGPRSFYGGEAAAEAARLRAR